MEQAKSPEWKARREAIFDRDGRMCVKCGETEDIRVVPTGKIGGDLLCHNDYFFITLCGSCRDSAEELMVRITEEIASSYRAYRFTEVDVLKYVHDFLMAIYVKGDDCDGVRHIFSAVDLFWSAEKEYTELREQYELEVG
jgi:hypothetical protein